VIGGTLSHYKILEKLGTGGMGEVYVAEDTTLGRQVALKVLRPEAMASPERRKRFEREAKALAALAHPNIVTVYSVEQAEGVDFITMELVRGKPLSRQIPKGGLTLSEFFALAIPLTDAVAAAHEQGITHRDLKPDNVMVGPDGRLRVLDFGLAKLKQESLSPVDSQTPTQSQTREGQIVGTVAYMSPEQAEGREVDHRSDIFSLGILLYEMATGERPFRGESAVSLMTSILRDTPPSVTELRPILPMELGKIIRRALAKDREQRIQTAKELRNELQELKAEVDSGEAWQRAVRAPRWKKRWAVIAALAVVAIGAAVGIWVIGPGERLPAPTIVPVTNDGADKGAPALSPDGNLVAFVRYQEAGSDLYVKQIGGGEPIRVAQGLPVEPIRIPRGVYGDARLSWSPDGREIAFFRHVETAGQPGADAVFVVPALGGAERQLAAADTRSQALAWSPDGRLLALTHRESPEEPDGIFLLSRETGEKRRLTRPPPQYLMGDFSPAFSPDGRTLAFVRASDIPESDIYLVPVAGGEPRRLTSGNRTTVGLAWAPDGKSIVFSSSRSPRAGYFALWRVSVSGGEPQPLQFGEQGISPTVSGQAHRLVYVKRPWNVEIWRVGGPRADTGQDSPARLISSGWNDWSPEWSADGRRILFNSTRSGYSEIWVCDSDGSNPRQLTSLEDPLTLGGGWSPDGRQIAFMSPKEGSSDLYVVDAAGGIPHRLTTDSWNEWAPGWSRDERWIRFSSNRSGRNELWQMPPGGGEAIQVTRNGGGRHAESPGGRYLFFTKSGPEGGPSGLWRMSAGGGEEAQILEHVRFLDWALFDEGICYINREAERGPVIEFFEFSTEKVRQITELDGQLGPGFTVSPDGRWILFVRENAQSDIMLVENFR
jgi:Tol biopolymer transport system component/tRNA A-37 threonylcarbamoyl transferase component Bud32